MPPNQQTPVKHAAKRAPSSEAENAQSSNRLKPGKKDHLPTLYASCRRVKVKMNR
jgi:hypothetical protein